RVGGLHSKVLSAGAATRAPSGRRRAGPTAGGLQRQGGGGEQGGDVDGSFGQALFVEVGGEGLQHGALDLDAVGQRIGGLQAGHHLGGQHSDLFPRLQRGENRLIGGPLGLQERRVQVQ